jgi:acetyl-CoA carboxylase biotin carboxyl carrier protein
MFDYCFFYNNRTRDWLQTQRNYLNQERPVDLKDIKAIIDLMRKNAVSELELEKPDFKIRLKRVANGGGGVTVYQDEAPSGLGYASAPPSNQLPAGTPAAPAAVTVSDEIEIKSPMVGTFYKCPTPEAGPYVEVGTEVTADSVICIIEAMKVMNEIKAELSGVVTQVLVDNAKPVEYGQPLFKIKPR